MDIKHWTRKTSRGFYSITEVAAWMGCVAIAGIVLLVFADVCGRYFLNRPVLGSYELVEQTMAIVGGSAIMYAAVKRGHVAIDLLTARFPRHTQAIMQSIYSLLGFGAWAALDYVVYMRMLAALESSETVSVLLIKTAPFLLILAVAVFLCSLTLLIQAFHPVASEETMEGKE